MNTAGTVIAVNIFLFNVVVENAVNPVAVTHISIRYETKADTHMTGSTESSYDIFKTGVLRILANSVLLEVSNLTACSDVEDKR